MLITATILNNNDNNLISMCNFFKNMKKRIIKKNSLFWPTKNANTLYFYLKAKIHTNIKTNNEHIIKK